MSELPKPVTTTQDPSFKALLQSVRLDLMTSINCAQVGAIVAFDTAKQTASVQLKVMRLVADRTSSPAKYIPTMSPLLVDVPVMILSGGFGRITFPITAGDSCLVIFNDRDIDNWFSTGGNFPPNSVRTHDLSDGFALVGFRNLRNALPDYNPDDVEVYNKGGKLKVNDKIALDGADASLRSVLEKCKDALTALNAKTGPSAGTEIDAFNTEIDAFLQ